MAHHYGAPMSASCILAKTAAVYRSSLPASVRRLARDTSASAEWPEMRSPPGRRSCAPGRHYFRSEPRSAWSGPTR
jgi:hypothetical protein